MSSPPAPADAGKPDGEAVADVRSQVVATGSVAAAATELARVAATGAVPAVVARRQWLYDPEEEEYLAGKDEDEDDDDDENTVVDHLQEVVPGLWIGDLVAAMDAPGLKERGIANVVSLLRPRLAFPDDMSVFALEIDDAPGTDILVHLPGTTAWIREALSHGREDELDVEQNDNEAEGQSRAAESKESKESKADDDDDDIAPSKAGTSRRHIDIPSTAPSTRPGGVLVHCQAGMSRSATVVAAFLMRELDLDPVEAVSALREARPVVDPSETFWHQLGLYYRADGKVTLKDRSTRQWYLERTTGAVMNDGALPSTEHMARYPATPTASQPATPAGSAGRRKIRCKMCRRHLAVREHMMDHILDQTPEVVRPRTPSNFALPAPLSTLAPADDSAVDADGDAEDRPARARTTSVSDIINPLTGLPGRSRRESAAGVATPPTEGRPRSRSVLAEALTMSRQNGGIPSGGTTPGAPGRQILDADALAARLPPQLAALRSGGMMPTPEAPRRLSSGLAPMLPVSGPPIIANPKCSGYFVEPLTWMEPMLDGAVSGKLFCPNEKCKAKIGTYDWAGVQCGCREWVTPGFCLARNRVEEVGF